MREFASAKVPPGKWRVLTSFDTLLYYDHEGGELRHDEVGRCPRNVAIEASAAGAALRIDGPPGDEDDGPRPPALPSVGVRDAGPARSVALCLDGALATAFPDGSVSFTAHWLRTWESFRLVREDHLDGGRYWAPSAMLGGTQLMHEQLRQLLGADLDKINLVINSPWRNNADHRPLVVWLHNEPERSIYNWCRNPDLVGMVDQFVFVSEWHRHRFVDTFELPLQRCRVIRNAIHASETVRPWPRRPPWRWRCAYISAPHRGLDVLLEAWDELSPQQAELHIWSGYALWNMQEQQRELFSRAMEIPNVIYHRIAPNATVRAALADMHFLLYPCTYDETFCISMVEAMSAGCRVIAPSRAALTETSAGFAKLYLAGPDPLQHRRDFIQAVQDEFARPWAGRPELAEAAQAHCRVAYDWAGRASEWRAMIEQLSGPL